MAAIYFSGYSWRRSTYHPISLQHNEGDGTFVNQNSMIAAQIADVPKGGGAVFFEDRL